MTAAAPVDTSTPLEIAAAPGKLLLHGLGALGFVAAGLWMIGAQSGSSRHSVEMIHLIGYAAVAFFGGIAVLVAWRLFTQRGTVITLAPEGLRDLRVSNDWIPWPGIASLKTWSYQGQRIMVVGLHPGVEERLKLTSIARMSRKPNAMLGADGLAIAAQGTKIGHDDLMAAAIAFAERWGRPG